MPTRGLIMNLNDYQRFVDQNSFYQSKGNKIIYPTLGIVGEAGEVAEQVKKLIRDDGGKLTEDRRKGIVLELGDVLWYMASLCVELGIDFDDVATINIEKIRDRQKRGTLHGDGNNR
jgi:NTP pyrophosphatase (non-canonical NTP hydrolase)